MQANLYAVLASVMTWHWKPLVISSMIPSIPTAWPTLGSLGGHRLPERNRKVGTMGDRSLRLDVADETFEGLERLARETGRSPAEVAREAVQRYVEYESWKAEKIERGLRAADAGEFASDEEMGTAFDRYRQAIDDAG